MYKAYYFLNGAEYYFYFRPTKADLVSCLKKDGNYNEEFNLNQFEITKLKISTQAKVHKRM